MPPRWVIVTVLAVLVLGVALNLLVHGLMH